MKDVYDVVRKKELYNVLRRINSNRFVDQEELVTLVGLYPSGGSTTFHDSTARRLLTRDIQEINEDPDFPMIIISSPGRKGVKIATNEEASAWVKKQKFPCFKKLKRIAVIENKLSLHGQMDLEGKEYEEEREVV